MTRKRMNHRKDKRVFHKTATSTKVLNNVVARGGKRF